MLNIYIFYEINLWPFSVGKYLTLGNSLFETVKLAKNADPYQYKYSGYDNDILNLMHVEVSPYKMVVCLVKMW